VILLKAGDSGHMIGSCRFFLASPSPSPKVIFLGMGMAILYGDGGFHFEDPIEMPHRQNANRDGFLAHRKTCSVRVT